jgi:oxygen-independent coproporphyrinogen-3 oxidase
MIVIKCKNNSDLNSIFNLTKAFFPNEEIKQQIDQQQEPQVHLRLDGGSCFSVSQEDVASSQEEKYLLKKVYYYLSQSTNKELPWGILTGVRPTKLVLKLLEEYEGLYKSRESELLEALYNKYYISREKSRLAIAVAIKEKEVVNSLDLEEGFSLFVNIPFCPSICSYCSFGSGEIKNYQNIIDEYVEKVSKEIVQVAKRVKGKDLVTIYIGGGTPTTLNIDQLKKLLGTIKESFSMDKVTEYMMEAGRPETITKEKLKLFKEEGINRLSINPQSMNQKTLDGIGRNHSVDHIIEVFKLARSEGFDNINMDLIVGLPGEGVTEIKATLEQIKSLNPDSITIHTLAMKRGSKDKVNTDKINLDRISTDKANTVKEEVVNKMLNLCYDAAKEMNLEPYYLYRQKNITGNFENVGFAKVDKVGIYNILIIEELQTIIGVGAGAITKLVLDEDKENKSTAIIKRFANTKSIEKYIKDRIDLYYFKEWPKK